MGSTDIPAEAPQSGSPSRPAHKAKNSRLYTLLADKARKDDAGSWRVEVMNDFGKTTATCDVKVVVEEDLERDALPAFLETLENDTVEEDDKVVLRCKSVGKPEPEVKWFRDDVPIDDCLMYKISSQNGRQKLEINKVKLRDSGIYRCKISNSIGWAACDAKLFVLEKPEVDGSFPFRRHNEYTIVDKLKGRRASVGASEADIFAADLCNSNTIRKFLTKWRLDDADTLGFPLHLTSKCAVEGQLVSLNCLVRGIPPYRIRWFKDHNEIFEGNKYFLKNRHGVLTLDILQTTEADTGNYMCEVRNSQGKIYSSCYLQVEPMLDTTNEVPTKPEFLKPMKRLTVNEGEVIRFAVAVKGYPAPGFKWFKDGLEIHDSDRITTEVNENGVAQLVIEQATVRDIGLYTCEAHNLAGRARSMVRISVRDKYEAEAWSARSLDGQDVSTTGETESVVPMSPHEMEKTYIPQSSNGTFNTDPIFTLRLPRTLTIRDKGRFLLECCCNGFPRPIIKWFKDGEELQENQHYNFLNLGDWFGFEIVDASISDMGTYSVKIMNSSEETESVCKVDMQLPIVQEQDPHTVFETAPYISRSGLSELATQACHDGTRFDIAQVVPSCTLCNTEIDWTAYIEKEVEVVFASEAPSFSSRLPDKLTPVENQDDIKLECQVKGEPAPKVVWLKDGQDMEKNDRVRWSYDPESGNAELIIKKVGSSDSGKYSCVAFSEHGGFAEMATIVQIQAKEIVDSPFSDAALSRKTLPKFKVKLKDTQTVAGLDVKLSCKAEGFPSPEVTWYRNDEPIEANIDKYTISIVDGYHVLKIASVHLSDADCYKCEAVNTCGAVSTCAHIVVQEECSVVKGGDPPYFSEPLHSVMVTEGKGAEFRCTAKGSPPPKLYWKKEGCDAMAKYRTEAGSKAGEAVLKIKSATKKDAGLFICVAENEHGKVESCATLKVFGDYTQRNNGKANGKNGNGAEARRNSSASNSSAASDGNGQKSGARERLKTKQQSLDTNGTTEPLPSVVNGKIEYKKMPKFVQRPFSQWVMKNDPLRITFEVFQSNDLNIEWYHNDQPVNDSRFKVLFKDN